MAIYQAHHEFPDGHTHCRAQFEVDTPSEINEHMVEVNKLHPLPEGAEWIIVPKNSAKFVKCPLTDAVKKGPIPTGFEKEDTPDD